MATIGYATLQIIPSMRGISSRMSGALGNSLVTEGRRLGQQAGEAIAGGLEGARGRVEKATAAVAKARDKEATASEKVRVAEAKLQALRDRGVTDAGRIAAAEAGVSKARRDQVASSRDVASALRNQQRARSDLTQAQGAANSSTNNLNGTIGRLREGLSGVSSVGSRASGMLAGLGRQAGAAALGFAGFQGVKSFLSSGWDRLSAIDDAQAKLKALGHDAAATTKIMDSATESVKGTAFGLGDAAGLAAQAVAAGVKPGQDLTRYLSLIGDTAAVAGVGLAEIGSIFTKVQGAGSASNEELAQLADRGIPIMQALAKSMGVPVAEVKKLASEGKVTADVFSTALTDAVGGAAKNMDSTGTAAANARAAFGRLSAALLKPVFDIAKDGLKGLTGALDAMKPGAETVASVIGGALATGINAVRTAASAVAPVLQTVGSVFSSTADFVSRNREAFLAVAGTILALFLPALMSAGATMAANAATVVIMGGAMRAYSIAMKIAAIATKAFAIAQRILSAAFIGNPIGLLIAGLVALGAGLVIAYKKSETFRNIVQSAWNGIKAAASATVSWFMDTAWPAIKGAFESVGNIATWLWNNAITPAWNGIKVVISVAWTIIRGYFNAWLTVFRTVGTVATWLWQNVMVPVWNGIKTVIGVWWAGVKIYFNGVMAALRLVGSVANWLWRNVMVPVWNGINAAISIAWAVIRVIFNAIQAAIRVVGDVVMWLWNNVVAPAWDGIKAIIGGAWNGVIKPVLDGLTAALGWVGDKAMWLWQNVMVPAWDAIKGAISKVWNFIKPILTNIGRGIQSLGDIAGKVGDAMRNAFNGVVDVLKAPIHAVGRLLASLPGSVMGIDIPGVSTIKSWGETLQSLRSGGYIDAAPGGFVVNAAATRQNRATLESMGGRMISGPGSGTSDSITAMYNGQPVANVSNREMYFDPDAARTYGPVLAAINGGARIESALSGGGILAPWPGGGGEGNLKPIAVRNRRMVHKWWPMISEIGGYRASDPFPDHPSGQALDIMTSDVRIGTEINDWLHANKAALHLNYTIWQQRYQPASGGGNVMEDRGSPTQNHMDHIHALFGQIGSPPNVNPNVIPEGLTLPPGAKPAIPDTNTKTGEYTPPELVDTTGTDGATTTPSTTPSTEGEKPKRMKSFRELGQDVGGLVADGIVDFFGIPSWIADPESAIKIDEGDSVRTDSTTEKAQPELQQQPTTQTPAPDAPQQPVAPPPPKAPGPKDYSGWITKAAKDLNLPEKAAVIGNATGLVESGDPMKMWANNAVPESLKYPHDAVGSDHDSVGLFQQRDNGAWGTVAQRMSPYESAKLFYGAMVKVNGWETMPEGDVAQATQRSAFPDRYATKVPRARELVKSAGLYDTGGWLAPGGLAVNHLNKPEPVLHPDHWASVVDQTAAVRELVTAGGGGNTTNVTVYGNTAGDIADEMDRRAWRGAGGYGSRGR